MRGKSSALAYAIQEPCYFYFSEPPYFMCNSPKVWNAQSKTCACVLSQSCLTLCDPAGCSPLGSSVHGVLQARVLERIAISFFRAWPMDWTHVSCVSWIGRQILYHCANWEAPKLDLHDPDNHNGVITHLEPDILECEVKWTLENIITNKANGGDGILVQRFQFLKDDAVTVLHSICQKIWKTQ